MAKKIGIVLALDGESKFTQGMKNASQSAKLCEQELKNLKEEYKGNANTLDALTKKQEQLVSKQQALSRVLAEAQKGQKNAVENYKKASERLEELKGQLDKAQKSMIEMEKAGDTSSKAYRAQTRHVEELKTAIQKQSAEQSKASGNITKWDISVSKANGDLSKANKAVEQNAKYVDEAAKSADKCAVSIDKMGRETDAAGEKFSGLGGRAKDALTTVAANLVTHSIEALGDAAVDAAKYVVDAGSSFEAAMSEVEAISGATSQSLDQMAQKAKALGSSTKFSATEVAQGFKYMSLAGWDTQQMLSSIDGIVNLAAASEMELGEASDMVTDYLSAFGLAAEDAGKMADQMAYAQANSNTTVAMLGESFSNCAANMHAANQDMETTTAILEAMANQGTKGAEAGTALAAMMRDISQKAKDGEIMIGKTAVSIQDTEGNFRDLTEILRDIEKATQGMGTADRDAALRKTFTARSIKAVNEVLTEGTDAIADYEEKLRKSDGAASSMATTMQDNFVGATTRFKSATEGLGVAIYETIQKPLTGLVDIGADVVGGLAEHFQGIADALTPAKTELQEFLDLVVQNNENAIKSLDTSGETVTSMTQEVGELERYKTVITSLNEEESLNELQKYQLKTAVDALSSSIPELADAYDGTTGKIKLEREEIEKLIDARQREVIETAKSMAQQEAMQALYTAQLAAAQAESTKTAAQAELDALNDQKQAIQDAAATIQEITGNITGDMTEKQQKDFAAAQAVLESYGYTAADAGHIVSNFDEACSELGAEIETQSSVISKAEKELTQANDTVTEATTAYEGVAENAESAAQATMEVIGRVTEEQMARQKAAAAAEKEADARGKEADATADAVEEEEKYSQAQEDAADNAEVAAKATKAAGTARKEAADLVAAAFDEEEKSAEELQKELEDLIATNAEEEEINKKVAEVVKAKREEEEAAAKAAEENAKRLEEHAKRMEDAQVTSAENIRSAWAQLKADAESKLSFDLFSGFNGGEDQTTESMNANLDAQLAGFEHYSENLQKLSEHIGKEISPEFAQYVEDMGLEGANTLEHIIWTLENQGDYGAEQVKGLSDKFAEAMNWQDALSTALAGDKAALSDGLKAMGSTDEEFEDLKSAMTKGLTAADTETQERLQSMADTAQDIGATIPDGLTDAIKNGEINTSQIEEELNASIQGALEGLLTTAEEAGADVDDKLAESIKDGTAAPQEAYKDLIKAIADGTGIEEDTETGKEYGSSIAENIAGSEAEVTEAVTAVVDAAITALSDKNEDFKTAGTEAAESFLTGLSDGLANADMTAGITTTAESIISAVDVSLSTAAAGLPDYGAFIAGNLVSELTAENVSADVSTAAASLITAADVGMSTAAASVGDYGTGIAENLAGSISGEDAKTALTTAGSALVGSVDVGMSTAAAGMGDTGTFITETLKGELTDETALSTLDTAGAGLISAVDGAMSGAADNASAWGTGMVDNLIASLTDAAAIERVKAAAQALQEASALKAAAEEEVEVIEEEKASIQDLADEFTTIASKESNGILLSDDDMSRMSEIIDELASYGVDISELSGIMDGSAPSIGAMNQRLDEQADIIADAESGISSASQELDSIASSYQGAADQIASAADQISESSTTVSDGVTDMLDGVDLEDSASAITDSVSSIASDMADDLASADNTAAVKDAGASLVEEIGTGAAEAADNLDNPLDGVIESFAGEEAQAAAESGGKTLGEAAATGAGSADMSKSATSLSWNFSKVFAEGARDASAAGSNVAGSAAQGAGSRQGEFNAVGQNMSAGVAAGISAGGSQIVNSMKGQIHQALLAAKAEAQIKSPSRKFRDQVGKQISAGTAFGIKQGTALTVAAANNMATKTLGAATSWLKKRKKSMKVSKQDEAYFWGQLAAVAKSGTSAYNTILNKAEKAAVGSRFGVSWWETTGSGKNKKKTKKSAEDYYSDVLSAAQDYYDMLTMNQDMSIRQELAYWQKVQKSLRKGTKAYQDAASKIKSIKEQIGGYDVASDLLDSFQVYQEQSEKAVMQYWDIIRKHYAEGTEDRLKADEQYLRAKEKYNDKLKDLEDDYASKVAETNQKYTDALEERTQAIAGAFDLFDSFESESDTGEQLLFNIQSQAEGYKYWVEQLKALQDRGILGSDLMSELTEKGPSDTAAVYALNTLSDEQLEAYNSAYNQKMDLARQQATEDEKELKQSVEKELAELKSEYNASVSAVNQNLNGQMSTLANNIQKIASDQTAILVQALNNGKSAATAMATAGAPAITTAAAKTTTAAKSTTPNIKSIINQGKSRSKTVTKQEKADHHALWEYIVSKYGRTPTNTIYKQLASALGVKVSSTPTSAQKDKILAALKKKGYRSGSKMINGQYVWMDEDGLGSEMVLSRSDNAVLTRIPAKSAIAPAGLTDNLWKWGSISPDEYHLANMAAYNRQLEAGYRDQTKNADRSAELMGQMLDLMSEFMPYLSRRTEMNVDGRKLVSATSDYRSNDMAMRVRRRRA